MRVKVQIHHLTMYIVFHVEHKDQAAINVVLGRQWIGTNNVQIHWATQEYSIQLSAFTLVGKSSEMNKDPEK